MQRSQLHAVEAWPVGLGATMRPRVVGGVRTRPLYLETVPDPVFAIAHLPSWSRRDGTGVVLCPPFGWEDVCTYRTRRAWADALARVGQPAVRIDLPGTGDSAGSPTDPGRLLAWTEAVSAAASWLREETECERIAGLGIGLGGMIACLAAARGAPIDDLMLWAVPTDGRRLLREIRAAALLAVDAGLEYEDGTTRAPRETFAASDGSGLLDLAGHPMTIETIQSLAKIDLTKLAHPTLRRVLLLESDGLAVDKRLEEHFEAWGADVTVATGQGYGAMMRGAQRAKVPEAAIARSIAWLSDSDRDARACAPSAVEAPLRTRVRALDTLEVGSGGAAVRETPLSIELDSGTLFGILTEPADMPASGVCAVLFNVASDRRIGPNRAWVETARRWAARGVPVVRLDQPGVGDSDGEELYEDLAEYYEAGITNRTIATLDALEARGLPPRFILVGLCTGAHLSFQGALADRRVVGAFAINLPFFFRTWWAVHVLHAWAGRRRSRQDDCSSTVLARWAVKRLFPALPLARRVLRSMRRSPDRVDLAVNGLRDRGVEVLLMFSGGEPQYDELIGDRRITHLNRLPNVQVRRIPGRDHSIRSASVQRYVSHELDEALSRVIGTDDAAADHHVVALAAPRGACSVPRPVPASKTR